MPKPKETGRCLIVDQFAMDHFPTMLPDERLSNENPVPPEPGLFSTRKRAVESTLSLIGLAIGVAFMFTVLDANNWRAFGITLAVAIVCMIAAAIYRLIRCGRA